MAVTHLCCYASVSPLFSASPCPKLQNGRTNLSFLHHSFTPSSFGKLKGRNQFFALSSEFLGDFGARDPFPAEVESNFAEKVLGNVDTEHRILIPNLAVLSLAQQECSPISPSQPPMTDEEAQKLLKKIVGWRVVDDQGTLKLECTWKLRDFKCGAELINRVCRVVEATGHYPNLHLEQPNQVRVEIWTSSIGGLSISDFILAAKIDEIKTSDLVPKKRIWA